MQKKYPQRNSQSNDTAFWISYSDLMTAMMVLFMIMFVTALLSNIQQIWPAAQSARLQQEMKDELITELKEKYEVDINEETGDVTIKEDLLFDSDDATLKEEGKAFLKSFMPVYTSIVFKTPGREGFVDQIIIEGHADKTGTYDGNMKLSLDRANSVVMYIFSDAINDSGYIDDQNGVESKREILRRKLVAAGRSDQKPKESNDQSRRVEIKFRSNAFVQ